MSDKPKLTVHKFTLSSGKVIYLREPKVADEEEVAKLCGGNKENVALMGVILQREMLKQVLVRVDEQDVNPSTLNLDNVFKYSEYKQAQQAVGMLTGGEEDPNALKVELVSL